MTSTINDHLDISGIYYIHTCIVCLSLCVLLDLWYGTMYYHGDFVSTKCFLLLNCTNYYRRSWFSPKFQCLTFQITPTTLAIPIACNSNLFKTTPSTCHQKQVLKHYVLDLRQFVGSLRWVSLSCCRENGLHLHVHVSSSQTDLFVNRLHVCSYFVDSW